MNILLINHYAGSIQMGMEYRPFYLAREWVRAGHQVTIVASTCAHVRTRTPELSANWQETWEEGVRYLWVKTPAYQGNGAARVLNIFSFVSQLWLGRGHFAQNPPQAVIASSTYPLDMLPAAQIARRAGARLIYEVHDLWPLTLIEVGGMSRRHPFVALLQWAEDYAYRTTDQVVSILPKADSYMRQHGMRADKFVHIPNGIDLQEWELGQVALPDVHAQAIARARQQGHFLVAYAGAHGVANDLDSLVEAGRLLADAPVSIILVGQGPERERLQQKARAYGLENVLFLPSVPKNAIPLFLDQMDALYISLKNEPLFRFGVSPNKLMDYMMAARPVIYAIQAGNDPVQESGCGISIAPEQPPEIARAVRTLLSMSAEDRSVMGQNGKRHILAQHDYRLLAANFLAVLGVQAGAEAGAQAGGKPGLDD